MNPFEMTTIIVIAALISGVLRARYKHAPVAAAGLGVDARQHIEAQEARIARLEERIKALEAVVGDSQYELRQQFKDLSAR